MNRVYILQHVIPRGDHEDFKIIGIYMSQKAAEQAIASLKHMPGFRDPAGKFSIGPYVLDQTYWVGGFGVE